MTRKRRKEKTRQLEIVNEQRKKMKNMQGV